MKKRMLSILLCLPLCMTLLTPAQAMRDIILIAPRPSGAATFSDVESGDWFSEAVQFVKEKGLMDPAEEERFAPGETASRADVVTALWRLEGQPVCGQGKSGTFSDVPEYEWYTEAVEWAASQELVCGYGDGTFGPEKAVTREQMATILYRYEQMKGGGFKGLWMFRLAFGDVSEISEWAYEPLCWMTMHKVMVGKGNDILDPKGLTTRAEAAQLLKNYLTL